jgi:hypothetical protein
MKLSRYVVGISILSIKNGNDNVPIKELATTPKLSEIGTLSLTFVMLMRFFARLNIYYKTFTSRIGPMQYLRVYTLHIVLPQCRFLYRVSKAICKQLPPLQFLCANIASCVEKQAVK